MQRTQQPECMRNIAEEIKGYMGDPGDAGHDLNHALPSNFRRELPPAHGSEVAFNAERRERWREITRKEEDDHKALCSSLHLPVGSSEGLINRELDLGRQIEELRKNLPQLLDKAIENNNRELDSITNRTCYGYDYAKRKTAWSLLPIAIVLAPVYVARRIDDWRRHRHQEFPAWDVKKIREPRLETAVSPALDKLRALAKQEGLELRYQGANSHLFSVKVLLPKKE